MTIAIPLFLFVANCVASKTVSVDVRGHSKHQHSPKNITTEEALEAAEKRMNEFLALESPWYVYVAGVAGIIAFVCVGIGFLVWLVYLIFNCCICTRGFLGCFGGCMRSFCCFIFRRKGYVEPSARQYCLSTYKPFEDQFDEADEQCTNQLIAIPNARGVAVTVPYCEEHIGDASERLFKKAKPFEVNRSRYQIDFYHYNLYKSEPAAYATMVENAIEVAAATPKSPSGFVYIFRSRDDLAAVNDPGPSKPYFYKIGMTRKKSAKDRVDQWENLAGSVFGNVEGIDFWKVEDAARAETLIHTLLARERVDRYNNSTKMFEIEWFFQTRKEITSVIVAVVAAVKTRNFEPLLERN
jgi:hypothetical protein